MCGFFALSLFGKPRFWATRATESAERSPSLSPKAADLGRQVCAALIGLLVQSYVLCHFPLDKRVSSVYAFAIY
jgi:hypothetical protein